jgi:hypothetical protein
MSWDLEKTEVKKDNNISPEQSKWKEFAITPITDVFESLNEQLETYDSLIGDLQTTLDEIEDLSSKGGISLKTLFPKGYYGLVFIEPEYTDTIKSENSQIYAGRISLDGQVGISANADVETTLDMFKKTFSTTTT